MNSYQALTVSLLIGFLLAIFTSYLPIVKNYFESESAQIWMGVSVGVLAINLVPLLSEAPIKNNQGEIIESASLFYISVALCIFWFLFAVYSEYRATKK